jgi:HAD superfamily hydrolase (TIGR01509 family)
MDGVLIDSEPEYRNIEDDMFRNIGITPTEQDIRESTGRSNTEVWRDFKEKYGFSEDVLDLVAQEALTVRSFFENGDLRPIAPSIELLKRCALAGLKTAVATSSLEKNARTAVSRLGLKRYVDAIATADSVKRSKPAPDIFLLAARLLGAAPGECVVIEDAKNGAAAAKAAGMSVVGFKAPGSEQDLSLADIVVSSLDKINVDTLRKLAGG